MTDKKAAINQKLQQGTDWADFEFAVRQEAARLDLLQVLENGINGLPLALPPNAGPQQKWRDLAGAIKNSCEGSAGGFIKNLANVHNLNASQLFVALRGQFAQANLDEQTLESLNILGEEGKWDSPSNKFGDILSFIVDKQQMMLRLPQKFPVLGGGVEHHILEHLSSWFPSAFENTVSALQCLPVAPNTGEMAQALTKQLTRLVKEGKYKINNNRAFPTLTGIQAENSGANNTNKNKNKKKKKGGNGNGGGNNNGNSGGNATGSAALVAQFKEILQGFAANAKGGQKGSFPGGKGKGKKGSFQGYCHNCNKWGHRSNDCWSQAYQYQATWGPSKGKGKGKGKPAAANMGGAATGGAAIGTGGETEWGYW